jgi:HlyD family secretion protein
MVSTDGPSVKPTAKEVKEERRRRRLEARKDSGAHKQKIDRALVEFQPDHVEIEQRSVPGGARWTLYTVILLLIGAVVWASWAEVDQIVTCTGKLRTVDEPIMISAPANSPIKSIDVKFGDRVTVGQVIATLDSTFSESDLRQLENNIQAVNATHARLQAEQDGEDFVLGSHEGKIDWMMEQTVFRERAKEYVAKIEEFDAENNKLRMQSEKNLSEAEQTMKRLSVMERLEKSFRDLADKGSKSTVDVLTRELQTAETESKLESIKNEGRTLVVDADSLAKRRNAFIASWRSKIATDLIAAVKEENKLIEELTKAKRANQLSRIVVPKHEDYKEFVVLEVDESTVGSVVQQGKSLFKLVPYNAPLEVEIEVQGKDIARIRDSDSVRIKVNTFPFQKHGTLNGTIRTISYGAFEKQAASGVAAPGGANYIARVSLEQPIALENVPDDFRLVPGMTVLSEVKVGRRKVISYFLYPLIRYLDTGIREP